MTTMDKAEAMQIFEKSVRATLVQLVRGGLDYVTTLKRLERLVMAIYIGGLSLHTLGDDDHASATMHMSCYNVEARTLLLFLQNNPLWHSAELILDQLNAALDSTLSDVQPTHQSDWNEILGGRG